jgi:hypothetical protein
LAEEIKLSKMLTVGATLLQVLAAKGDPHLGGEDFDRALAQALRPRLDAGLQTLDPSVFTDGAESTLFVN